MVGLKGCAGPRALCPIPEGLRPGPRAIRRAYRCSTWLGPPPQAPGRTAVPGSGAPLRRSPGLAVRHTPHRLPARSMRPSARLCSSTKCSLARWCGAFSLHAEGPLLGSMRNGDPHGLSRFQQSHAATLRGCRRGWSLLRPILTPRTGNQAEVRGVPSDHGVVTSDGSCGDTTVVGAKSLGGCRQLPVRSFVAILEGKDVERVKVLEDVNERPVGSWHISPGALRAPYCSQSASKNLLNGHSAHEYSRDSRRQHPRILARLPPTAPCPSEKWDIYH